VVLQGVACPGDFSPRSRLYGNQIGEAGAAALTEALKSNATLTSLE
jgi:hypothetical protein